MNCRVDPVKLPRVTKHYTEDDLVIREFLPHTSRQLVRKGRSVAA